MHAMPKIQLPYFKQTGFTLIELLVVVAITSIVVGGAIAGFTTFAERQKVLTTAQEVRQLFVSAKTKAQVQETPTSCAGPLRAYRVTIGNSSASIRSRCENAGGTVVNGGNAADYPSVSYTSGSVTPTGNYDFYTLNDGVSFSTDRTISVVGNGKTHTFTITTGGAISDVQ